MIKCTGKNILNTNGVKTRTQTLPHLCSLPVRFYHVPCFGSCSLDPSITTEGSRQFSDLVKMDPCFIFNHAKLSPICHVYSVAQRMNRRPAHYLDV